jgi:D-alanine-D-alanine ligase
LELSGVPYVGCGVAASAIAMDKVLTKLAAKGAGIDVTKFEYFSKNEFEIDPDEWVTRINRHLRYPLFVKPAHLGSSIGITRVVEPADLRNAIEVALHYDTKALVEEGVENLVEVTLPIMGDDLAGEPLRPALLERPMVHSEDFFDFDTKYMHGGKKGGKSGGGKDGSGVKGAHGYSELPAQLDKDLYAKTEAVGLAVYRALGCSGTARVDMLIDSKEGIVYCNEVNPLPGSLYAHNWAESGVSAIRLVSDLVRMAQARHEGRATIETTFATNFLKQF